jgi:GMP reductase
VIVENGKVVEHLYEERKFKKFYGMSSDTAMDQYSGGVAKYKASEGKTVKVPYRGPVANTIQDVLGGLRSACSYVGASKLKDLSKRTTFVRVTQQINEVFGKAV